MDQILEPRTVREQTRRTLHGIAECLLAGPQHRASGEIALRITDGGFATTTGPALELDGLELIRDGGRRIEVAGTFASVADLLGVTFGPPDLGYPDGSGALAQDPIMLDPDETRALEEWYVRSDHALRILDPTQTPILWPEHFDVAVLLNGHSFGSSPGDDAHPRPYAYVSAPDNDGSDYFNVAFGALRDATDLTTTEELLTFWREGLTRIAMAGQ